MLKNYLATNRDFDAIRETLNFVWKNELEFIFRDKTKIKGVTVVSYDYKNIYVWERKSNSYYLSTISHKLKLDSKYYRGWRAYLAPDEINRLLPKRLQGNQYNKPKISGGLIGPFINLQKKKHLYLNPYTSYESYLATIVHEFAHIYYNQYKLWWHSNKKENLDYINESLKLYEGIRFGNKKINLWSPTLGPISELFAFCTEYTAASIFWKNHKDNLDRYYTSRIKKLRTKEQKLNLDIQNSVLDESSHDMAAVLGKILVEKKPKEWPELLLRKFELS